MLPSFLTRIIGLGLGTLYPAYASFKAVKTKNVREYVKWMMYWIVFALFSVVEVFADIFLSFWFPFYYEAKVLFIIWLISPVSRESLGSSILYRSFIHPALIKHEKEIDSIILKLQNQGYNTVTKLAVKGFRYASNLVMQTVITAPVLMNEILEAQRANERLQQRSIDATDSSEPRLVEVTDEVDTEQENLDDATHEHISGTKTKTKAKPAKKPKKTTKKKAAIELSSESDEADFHDMDIDRDPEVTMAAMGPLRGPEAGPTTRNRAKSNSKKKSSD